MARKNIHQRRRPVLPDTLRRKVYSVRLLPTLVAQVKAEGQARGGFTRAVEQALLAWLDRH